MRVSGSKKKIDKNKIVLAPELTPQKKPIEEIKIILTTELSSPKKWNENKIKNFGYHKAFLGYLYAFYDHCPIKVSPNVI